jgi:type IV secretory pathway TraG/TraD family ATPase VirD4
MSAWTTQQESQKSPIEQTKDGAFIIILGAAFLVTMMISKALHISFTTSLLLVLGAPTFIGLIYFIYRLLQRSQVDTKTQGPRISVGTWIREKWFDPSGIFEIPLRNIRHILITGVTGSGKSTLIRRIMSELNRLKRGYLYIDFKGEERELNDILQSISQNEFDEKLQIFDLSNPEDCATCNLLTIFPDVEETIGFAMEVFGLDHPYYKSEAEQFIRHSLNLLDGTDELRSFENLERLCLDPKYRSRLLNQLPEKRRTESFYLYFQETFTQLSERDRAERFSGLLAKLNALTSPSIKHILNAKESTFKLSNLFEEARPTIIRIPGEAYGDLSKRIVQAFIKAIPVLLSRRRKALNPKDYFIFLDEQCSYTSDTVVDILKKAGSARVHCVLTRQCDGDFDGEGAGFLSKVISACSLGFTFQVLDPLTRDSLSKQMGTLLSKKQTWRVNQGGATGEASEREAHQFNIPPNTFLHLQPGQCIVSANTPGMNFNRKMKVLSVELPEEDNIHEN